jgi:hypothetical protein
VKASVRLAEVTAILGVEPDLSGNEPDERGNFVALAVVRSESGIDSLGIRLNLN